MFGTVARMRPKAGHIDELMKMNDEWEREHAPNIDGFVASYVMQIERNPEELFLVAIFEDREAYFANANRPEQDRWFQKVREHLESDPTWEDGEVIYSMIGSRPEPTV
jgi:quinol monooxygenase YgiN